MPQPFPRSVSGASQWPAASPPKLQDTHIQNPPATWSESKAAISKCPSRQRSFSALRLMAHPPLSTVETTALPGHARVIPDMPVMAAEQAPPPCSEPYHHLLS